MLTIEKSERECVPTGVRASGRASERACERASVRQGERASERAGERACERACGRECERAGVRTVPSCNRSGQLSPRSDSLDSLLAQKQVSEQRFASV